MKKISALFGAIALTATMIGGSVANAGDAEKPVGKVTINETQFALVLGGSVGGGTLEFGGKSYDFKIGGLTVGANVGISKMDAAGEVYELKNINDFPGTYTKLDASITLGGGVGGLRLKNEHGVIMRLVSRNQGLQLNIASATGVKVTMK